MAVILLSAAYVLSARAHGWWQHRRQPKSSGAGQRPRRRRSRQNRGKRCQKDINLAIARLLKKKLEKQGILVVMTREGEDDLSDPGAVNAKVQDLQRRVQLIHEKKPDCVISIHQNSYPDAAVKGAQVFYYTDSKEGEKLALCMQAALVAGLDPANHRESQGKQNVLHAEEDRRSAGDLRVRIPLKSGGGSAPEHKGVPEKGGGCTV